MSLSDIDRRLTEVEGKVEGGLSKKSLEEVDKRIHHAQSNLKEILKSNNEALFAGFENKMGVMITAAADKIETAVNSNVDNKIATMVKTESKARSAFKEGARVVISALTAVTLCLMVLSYFAKYQDKIEEKKIVYIQKENNHGNR